MENAVSDTEEKTLTFIHRFPVRLCARCACKISRRSVVKSISILVNGRADRSPNISRRTGDGFSL